MTTTAKTQNTMETLATYRSVGHRNVTAETPSEAAELFALRKARAVYGKTARVGALRADAYSQDRTTFDFDAFIGYPAEGGGICGHNVRFTIHAVN